MSTPAPGGQDSVPRELVLVEDNPGDARLVSAMLQRGWTRNLNVHSFATLGEAVAHLETRSADCVLLDLSLPDSQGVEGVRRIASRFPALPVVVLSGTNEEALVLDCLHEGAQDYLVKGQADGPLLGRAIRYAVERKRSERELAIPGEPERRAYRLSAIGVAAILVILAAFSIGAATITKHSADRLEEASALSAAYGQALEATGAQDSLVADATLGGLSAGGEGSSVAGEHRRAAESLTAALDGVRTAGGTADRELADRVHEEHGRYLEATAELFAAARAGVPTTALIGRRRAAEETFSGAEQELAGAAATRREATLRRVAALSRADDAIFVATLVAFSVGLLLLGVFGGVIRGYRGRFEQARRAELARRARGAAAAA